MTPTDRPLALAERRALARRRHAALVAEMDRKAGIVTDRRSRRPFVAVDDSRDRLMIFRAEPGRDRPG